MTSKTEQARRDAFRHAYHIMDKAPTLADAKAEIGARLTRAEMADVPVFIRDADVKEYEYRVKSNVFTMVLACCMATLESSQYGFQFTSEQMDSFGNAIAEQIDTIYGGWLEFDDLILYFKDEYGVDLAKYVNESESRQERIEEKLNKRTAFVGEKRVYQRRLTK